MKKLILLDAGGVLVESHTSEKVSNEIADRAGKSRQESWDYFRGELYHDAWVGKKSEKQLWEEWLKWAGLPISEAATWHDWAIDNVVPRAGALDAIRELSESAAAGVWLLSNHCADWLRPGLERASILPHLDRVFISSEIGSRKPHQEAYAEILSHWEGDPETVLYVDDNPFYLEGGAQSGMTVHLAQGDTDEWLTAANKFLGS